MVVLPSSVIKIKMSALENCSNLESVELPDKLELIGNCAFSNCTKLLSINIGQIGSIGEGVLENTPNSFTHKSKMTDNQEQLMELTKYSIGD